MASEALRLIKEHFGNQTFRVRDAADAGIPRHILYEVPNITALPIIGANPDYLEWADTETAATAA